MPVDDWQNKHHAWRKRVARNMPATVARVFALRGKPYPGYGFHYAMEKTLGSVMRMVNNYDDFPSHPGMAAVEQIVTGSLFKDIAKAERA